MTAESSQVTSQLATLVAGLSHDQIPDEVSAKVQHLFLDFVGATIGGAQLPEVHGLVRPVLRRGAASEATVLGVSAATSIPDAAFCNGVAGDVLEHQDGYRFGGFHPSHLLPALLAVAEHADITLEDFYTAATASYEVANRISLALHPAATARGWFPPSAAYGAACGSARLLGLDVQGITAALGITAYFAPAIFIDSIFGGWTAKPAFAGQLARAGVEGALAAAEGLTGWPEVVEAPRGLVDLLAGREDDGPALAAALDGLGTTWTVLDVHQKRFAGCRHTHAAAQAALEAVSSRQVDPEEIERVDVEAYSVAKALVDRHVSAGSSSIACTLSLPYVVAAAVVHGEVTGRQYTREAIDDPRVQSLARRVTLSVADDLEDRYPDYTASRVNVSLRDGSSIMATVDLPAGDARAPLSVDDLLAKYHGYADAAIGRDPAARSARLILETPSTTTVRQLVSTLAGSTERKAS